MNEHQIRVTMARIYNSKDAGTIRYINAYVLIMAYEAVMPDSIHITSYGKIIYYRQKLDLEIKFENYSYACRNGIVWC